jgi:hypothetical protein
VLELAQLLRSRGVDVLMDAWDLGPDGDVPKFMERGVRDANRALMICTRALNEGIGGAGCGAMIVSGRRSSHFFRL